MNIPNLPTDNLYKFMALSGLVLFIISTIYPTYYIDNLTSEVYETGTEIGLFKIELKMVDEKIKDVGHDVEQLRKRVDRYNLDGDTAKPMIDIDKILQKIKNAEYRDYLKFKYTYQSDIFPEVRMAKEVDKKIKENDILRYDGEKRLYLIGRKNQLIEIKNKKIENMLWKWYFIQTIGGLLSIFGFWLWYFRVQRLLDIKLKKETSIK